MKVFQFTKCAAPFFALSIFAILVLPIPGLTQQRPGIRTFVTPPDGCFVIDPVETENLFSFVKAQIQALSLANAGEKANHGVLNAGNRALVDEMAGALAGLRQEKIEDTCASFVMSPYIGSKNTNITTAAKLLVLIYDDLNNMTDEMLKVAMQSAMSRRVGPNIRTLPELTKERQEDLGRIGQVLEISLSMLIDGNRTDSEGKPDHLILSQAQKNDLLEYLHAQFPDLVGDQAGKYAGSFAKKAAQIESFLSGPYKTADQ